MMEEQNNIEELDNLLEKLVNAQRNLIKCGNDMPQLLIEAVQDGDIENLKLSIHELLDKFNSVIGPLVEAKNVGENKIKLLETSYGELIIQLKNEQKKVMNLEQQIHQLADESAGQVNFCTFFGAALGNLLWKSSRTLELVDSWLEDSQQTIGDLLSITNTALDSFLHTFGETFPDIKDEQYKFMMSLLGTVTNISASPNGRQFLIKHENGKVLIKQIVKLLPKVPAVSGDPMKKLMLMILYNMSLNCAGLPFLINLKVYEIIAKCMDGRTDIQLICLRIIQSITYDIKDTSIFTNIFQLIAVEKIQKFMSSTDSCLSDAASAIIENIKKFHSTSDTLSDRSQISEI